MEKAQEAKEDIRFEFMVDATLKSKIFSSVQGMNLYRTIQEAINNSIKYAQPKSVTVSIEPDANGIAITIADDGKGFDREMVMMGNGIHNMQKRIQDIGGDFDLVSKLDHGTVISIRLKNQ
jgi:signal transduction histidine kinase